MNSYSNAARNLPRDERELREQRALELGPSDATHLRLIAGEIEDDGVIELPGVDADRLRLLARQLEEGDPEVEALREHANNLHRALCECIEDLESAPNSTSVTCMFVTPENLFAALDGLSPAAFSDLAIFLLDEVE